MSIFIAAAVVILGTPLLMWLLSSVVIPWVQRRCPSCSRYTGRVTRSSEIANVTTRDHGYDSRVERFREMETRHRGFLIAYRCDACGNEWERMRSRSRLVALNRSEIDDAKRRGVDPFD